MKKVNTSANRIEVILKFVPQTKSISPEIMSPIAARSDLDSAVCHRMLVGFRKWVSSSDLEILAEISSKPIDVKKTKPKAIIKIPFNRIESFKVQPFTSGKV